MSTVRLRPASLSDLAAIAALFIRTREQCLPYLNWVYSQEVMEGVFQHKLNQYRLWIAERDDAIIGFISYNQEEVEDLYVVPDSHRVGVGTRLLTQAIKDTTADIRLWVFQANQAAKQFYERHGFVLEFETDGTGNMEKTPDARYVLRRTSL